jgi:hypothetical protein
MSPAPVEAEKNINIVMGRTGKNTSRTITSKKESSMELSFSLLYK